MAKDKKEKQRKPPTTQDHQAPQDENPTATPKALPKSKNSGKTFNKQ
ncbi:MAG TPA: hypothetical protein VGK59_06135 [Ohtaekwangia sp.]